MKCGSNLTSPTKKTTFKKASVIRLNIKTEIHPHKTSWRHIFKIYDRCHIEYFWKMSYSIYLKDPLNMSQRCNIGDDLKKWYQKMTCRCLVEEVLKMFYILYLKDTLNLSDNIF